VVLPNELDRGDVLPHPVSLLLVFLLNFLSELGFVEPDDTILRTGVATISKDFIELTLAEFAVEDVDVVLHRCLPPKI